MQVGNEEAELRASLREKTQLIETMREQVRSCTVCSCTVFQYMIHMTAHEDMVGTLGRGNIDRIEFSGYTLCHINTLLSWVYIMFVLYTLPFSHAVQLC